MEEEPILLSEMRGHVLLLTLNRPKARNAINHALAIALGDAIEAAKHDPDIWVIVLTGAGDIAFSAGGDMKAMTLGEKVIPDDPVHGPWGFAGLVSHPISKPIIAAVNGFALGGGTEIACAADLIVAADTAQFGLPEVGRGFFAGAGGVWRIPEQIPHRIGMEMVLTGEPISAQRALELGFVNRVVPQSEVVEEALRLAERICRNAPLAVQASKRLALGMSGDRIAREEQTWQQAYREIDEILKTRDAREGPRAFVERRDPRWEAK